MPYLHSSDAPTAGAYKEQEVTELFETSGFDSVFRQLARLRVVAKGDTATIPNDSVLDFDLDNSVNENELLPESYVNMAAKTIALQERGHIVNVTNTAKLREIPDILGINESRLREHMKRDTEGVIVTALKTAPIKYVATSASAQSITTDGTASGTCASGPNFYHLRYLSRYMQDDLRIPFHQMLGDRYAGVFRYGALASIKSDSEYNEINRGLPEAARRLKGIGTIEDFAIMGNNDPQMLSNSIGSGSAFSEGLLLGGDAVYLCVQDDLSVKYDLGDHIGTDFGRFKYIAYNGHMGAGLPSDSANAGKARVIHWTSA